MPYLKAGGESMLTWAEAFPNFHLAPQRATLIETNGPAKIYSKSLPGKDKLASPSRRPRTAAETLCSTPRPTLPKSIFQNPDAVGANGHSHCLPGLEVDGCHDGAEALDGAGEKRDGQGHWGRQERKSGASE